jgi:hypothetical protein
MKSLNLRTVRQVDRDRFSERRSAPRFDASVIPHLKNVLQLEGPEVKLINISRSGALIETRERMPPKSRVSLRLDTTETVYYLEGEVLRCYVYEIDKVLKYQYAVEFDDEFEILPSAKEEF